MIDLDMLTQWAIRGALTCLGLLGYVLWLGAMVEGSDHAIAAERYERAYQRCVTTTTYELLRTDAAYEQFRLVAPLFLTPDVRDATHMSREVDDE
jgi:hypothetical protein